MFIRSRQFCRSLRDSLIEFIRNPLLLAEQPCFVQRKHCLIGCHPQKKLLSLPGEVRSLRPGDDRANFALQSQPQGHDAHILALEAVPRMRWPFLRIIPQQTIKLAADLAHL